MHQLLDVQPEDVVVRLKLATPDQIRAEREHHLAKTGQEEVGVVAHVLTERVVALRVVEHRPEGGAPERAGRPSSEGRGDAVGRGKTTAREHRPIESGVRTGGERQLDDHRGRLRPGGAGEVAARQAVPVSAEETSERAPGGAVVAGEQPASRRRVVSCDRPGDRGVGPEEARERVQLVVSLEGRDSGDADRERGLFGREPRRPAPRELVHQVIEDVREDHPPAHHVEVTTEPLGDVDELVAKLDRGRFGTERRPLFKSAADLDALPVERCRARPRGPARLVSPGALGDRERLRDAAEPRGAGAEDAPRVIREQGEQTFAPEAGRQEPNRLR